ncbi:leucine-rich repeat neuronal protein 1-like [Oratosquilla oratoria]|uniref:leucine-rich repeat neuronal protein 1-like n=1 Tax=Oratosquilla oratoria TaxID=337810 RepID=UPI003F7649B5
MIRVHDTTGRSNNGGLSRYKPSYLLTLCLTMWVRICLSVTNATCLDGCTCSLVRSIHSHQVLSTYDCASNNLREFPSDIPNNFQALNLSGNSILNVYEHISDLGELVELDLSKNRLKSIGRGKMFQDLGKLKFFTVSKNNISTVFNDNLEGLDSLEILLLSNNRITYIEDKAFSALGNLLILNLDKNTIGSLYGDWFVGLVNLTTLNLSHNRIHNLPAAIFKNLGKLERLYLNGNRISKIETRAFSELLSLKVLTLDDNLITKIPTTAFQSIQALESLTLDQNPLTKIKPLDFSHLSVTKINLCKMPELQIIDAKAFYNAANLSTLHIHENKKLAYVDPLAFMNLSSLQELTLHNNNLLGFHRDALHYLPTGIEISLFNNPLLCDCHVRWIWQAITDAENSSIILQDSEHLVCQYPEHLRHKVVRDLDTNRLSKTCGPVIADLGIFGTLSGKVGDRRDLECRALGGPYLRLHWVLPDGSKIGDIMNNLERRFFPPGTLVYFHLKVTDAGTYQCVAEDKYGKATRAVTLNVTGIDINFFPVGVSSTFVTLVWNGTERRLFPKYKITYVKYNPLNKTEIGESEYSIASSTRKTYTISKIQPDTTYKFCLGYEDKSGYYLQIACCVTKTQDVEFMMQGISHTSNVAAAVVISIVMFLTTVICLVSILSRRYKQRMYESPDKGTVNSHIPLENLYSPLLTGS